MNTCTAGIGAHFKVTIVKNNSLMDSPLLQTLFRADINLLHKRGYKIQTIRMERRVMYCQVDGYYPRWTKFIEPDCAERPDRSVHIQEIIVRHVILLINYSVKFGTD